MADSITVPSVPERIHYRNPSVSSDRTYSEAILVTKEQHVDIEQLQSATTTYHGGKFNNDDPFGGENVEGDKNYKTLSWWQAGALLIAETISLGILSLPKVVATVGFVPGIILIAVLGMMATYTGYVVFQFKQRYMGCHNFADAANMIFGPIGRWVVEVMQVLILLFIMGAHILTFTVEMNVLTNHATCTIVFGIIGTVVSYILATPRSFRGIAPMSIISCLSITTAIFIVMIGVGVNHPTHPETYAITPSTQTSFQEGSVSVSNIVVAYAGHVAFFQFISEMRTPQDFPKALALLQTAAIAFYITVGVVVYRYIGTPVASPALTSASPVIAKIAWGIAMPTIIIAGVVNGSVVCKNTYVFIWKDFYGTPAVMKERSFRAYASWFALCAASWILAWVIASAIPVFSDLLGLLGALFCSWFSLGLPTIFWFYMHKGSWFRDWKRGALFCVNLVILGVCCVVCAAGTYGSAVGLANKESRHGPFSCADNSK